MSVETGVGTAIGDSSASGASAVIAQVLGTAVGDSASTAVGVRAVVANFISNGNSTASGHGISARLGVGSAAGNSTASASSTYQIKFQLKIKWQVRGKFYSSISFIWQTGILAHSWYRVQGCCKNIGVSSSNPLTGCQQTGIQTDDSNCVSGKQQFIQNIWAANVADLCDILNNSGSNWQICSIKKFSQSAGPILANTPQPCNTLVDVPFCQIPNCIKFCLHENVLTSIKATTTAIDTIYSYTGSGGALCYGTASSEVFGGTVGPQSFEYLANGPPAITGGNATVTTSWQNVLITSAKMATSIQNLEAVFATVDSGPSLTLPAQIIVTNCGGCNNMPLIIHVFSNLVNYGDNSVFVDFIRRNGFTFPTYLNMYYSNRLQTWLGNLHFTGIGTDNSNAIEKWKFTFEWACLNQLDGQDLGSSSWEFAMTAVRKIGSENYVTRIMLVFPPDQVCIGTTNSGFDFSFSVNTVSEFVNGDVVPTIMLFNDGIGLFSSNYWVKNPNYAIRLSQNNTSTAPQTQDIFSIFPQSTVIVS